MSRSSRQRRWTSRLLAAAFGTGVAGSLGAALLIGIGWTPPKARPQPQAATPHERERQAFDELRERVQPRIPTRALSRRSLHVEATVTPDPQKRRRRKLPADLDLGRVDLSKKLSEIGIVRNVLFVPPSMPVAALLASMQASRVQMALVIDEYGGTDGLVSLEDVVEMVVGDIEDEHDGEDGPMIVQEGDGSFLADARADLDEVSAAIGTDLAKGEAGDEIDTVGGLVFSLLGRIPVRGELVSIPGDFEIEILDADPRRLKRLRIYRRPPGTAKPELRRRPKAQGEPESGAAA